MEATAEFELLYIDKKSLNKEKVELIKAEKDLNNFVREAKAVLGELDNDQLNQLKVEGIKFVNREVEKLFQFEKATRDFNLQSLGIDLTKLQAMPVTWTPYQFELTDEGEFIPFLEQRLFDSHYYYAKSDKQIKALALAESIVKLFEEARAEGHVRGEFMGAVSGSLKGIVKVEGDPRFSSATLVVDKRTISVIR